MTEGRPDRLPYWPALDGVRGLAVLAVLLFHGSVSWAQGGFLGVSLFFTLSGFLITSLLLAEHGSTGSVRLGAFWARRARRLLPASLVALVLATITIGIVVPAAERGSAVTDVRYALANLANWRFVWADQPYLEAGHVPSPVQHYWSLAIEEQFYLLYPLLALLALRWRARGLAVLLVAIALGSLVAQVALTDPTRIYYGTDARAAELAAGGLLACGLRVLRRRAGPTARRGTADVVGAAALAATGLLWWRVAQDDAGLYDGGLAVVALVSAALIYGAVEGRRVVAVLGVAPLRELGKISYGVYLFHFPIFLLLTEERTHATGVALFGMRFAATLAIALVSYHALELPIRRGRALPGQRAVLVLAGGATAVLLLGVPVQHRAQEAVAASTTSVEGLTVLPAQPLTEGTSPRAPRLVVVGDSTAGAFGPGLQAWGRDTGQAEVAVVSSSGCAPLLGERFKVREGYEFVPRGCDELLPAAVELARRSHADAFVVLLGSSQLADWRYEGSSGWQGVDEPEVAARYRAALTADLAELAAPGLPILFADVPTPAWDIDVLADQVGSPLPGRGRVTLNDPERAALLNRLDEDAVRAQPLARIWSLRRWLERPDGHIPLTIRPDGLHVAPDQVGRLAEGGLFDALRSAYAEIVAARPPELAPPAPTAWAPAAPVSASG